MVIRHARCHFRGAFSGGVCLYERAGSEKDELEWDGRDSMNERWVQSDQMTVPKKWVPLYAAPLHFNGRTGRRR
jgi:hypothetical protein